MAEPGQQFSDKRLGAALATTRVIFPRSTPDARARAPIKRIHSDPQHFPGRVPSPIDLDRIYHVRLPKIVTASTEGLPGNRCSNVRMGIDPLSPVAPARVRALLLPIGKIKRARFLAFVERLQPENVVRLGDISPDGRPNRSTHITVLTSGLCADL